MMKRLLAATALVAATALATASLATGVRAQGVHTYQCVGNINGVRSQAVVQVEGGGTYGGPYVAGQIQNPYTAYHFTGELFGGTEGYVSLVEAGSGQRIDRVLIGVTNSGFVLATEDGARYPFSCRA